MIRNISAEDLQKIVNNEDESDYLIVDVRQPEEYQRDHIPGSTNIPLSEIQTNPERFAGNRKLIFCCIRGVRSKVAAIFAADAGYDESKMFHLQDGLFEYPGEIVLEMPRVDLFLEGLTPSDMMEKVIELEKGAFRFYSLVGQTLSNQPLASVIKKMAKEEIAHGKSVYNQLKRSREQEEGFRAYFEQCQGEILEGGKSFREVEQFLSDNPHLDCTQIIETAIDIEYSAYDLYRAMAEQVTSEESKSMFLGLAQAEKKHLRQVVNALALCGNSPGIS